MKLLVLGGTRFVGKTIVSTALARGHEVTLFNRGSRLDVFPDVEQLIGDRDGNLEALKGRKWDAVVDTSGYYPRVVKDSVQLLQGHAGHYTFISTLDVYDQLDVTEIDEQHPVKPLQDEAIEDIPTAYGEMKARCEQIVESYFPGKTLVARCGLIVGPGDATDRFTYWPARVAKGGEILAPGAAEAPIQFIDVRDLASWLVEMIEQQMTGTYNATGPANPLTVGEFLQACADVVKSDARFTWVSDEFLLEQNVGPWIEMPLWIPKKENVGGLMALILAKAVSKGLKHRPLAETIADTLAWDQTRDSAEIRKAGLDFDKEKQLLEQWKTVSLN